MSNFYIQSTSTSTTSLSQSHTNSHIHDTPEPRTPSPNISRRMPAPLSLSTALDHIPSTAGDTSDYDDDIDTSLPFPAPLPRSDFLKPGPFDPSAYLSSVVAHRYQTLEDLRAELRTRAQSLNTELVELVNAHQEEFVGLGSSLQGGEVRVEELKVGVLGLRREIADIKGVVEGREKGVAAALGERRECRAEIEVGRACVEFADSLGVLAGKLGIGSKNREEDNEGIDEDEEDEDEDEDEESATVGGILLSALDRRIRDLSSIERTAKKAGLDHPFIQSQLGKLEKCRSVLLLDLGTCLKALKVSSDMADVASKMHILRLYGELKSSKEAVELLKGSR